ncbi:MAG: hypothetical protein ACYTFY_12245, partial [Planctomycetota bacterium]
YALIGTAAFYSLARCAEILKSQKCKESLKIFCENAVKEDLKVIGTHAFLSCLYAHVADKLIEGGQDE